MPDQTISGPELVRHSNPVHGNTVLVDWMLGNSCNYACSYCPAALHDGSIHWQRPEVVKAFFVQLHAHYVNRLGRTVWLQFTGGEPTLYPGLINILQAAHALGFRVSVISNGSRALRFWRQVVQYLDAAILTYHDEFADYEAFLDVCAIIASMRHLNVNVTAHPARFETILRRAEGIRTRCPSAWITLKPLRRDFADRLYDYSPVQLDQLRGWSARGKGGGETVPRGTMVAVMSDGSEHRQRANDFILTGSNRWRGYQCEAGVESLRVKGCGQVLRAVCGSGGVLGRLGEDFPLPFAPQTCDRDRCSCVADILITKRRNPA